MHIVGYNGTTGTGQEGVTGMNQERSGRIQTVSLTDRKVLELGGVEDVVRFDEESAVFATSAGMLTVEGKGLHVRVLDLDSGHVSVDGVVDSLLYEEPTAGDTERRGLFAKLFH